MVLMLLEITVCSVMLIVRVSPVVDRCVVVVASDVVRTWVVTYVVVVMSVSGAAVGSHACGSIIDHVAGR